MIWYLFICRANTKVEKILCCSEVCSDHWRIICWLSSTHNSPLSQILSNNCYANNLLQQLYYFPKSTIFWLIYNIYHDYFCMFKYDCYVRSIINNCLMLCYCSIKMHLRVHVYYNVMVHVAVYWFFPKKEVTFMDVLLFG